METTRDLEDALRCARAASHSRRLDTATQAALDAIVALGRHLVEGALRMDAELERACERVAALEATHSLTIRQDRSTPAASAP
jgi:hypothetical protein